jgi:hypothetical protein
MFLLKPHAVEVSAHYAQYRSTARIARLIRVTSIGMQQKFF